MAFDVLGISKSYPTPEGHIEALQSTSFSVNPGELVSLIGPSGCGKSTLLYILAGLETATAGEIAMDGRTLHGPGRDRGMVFQNYTLFPWLSVEKNVCFAHTLSANIDYHRSASEILHDIRYAEHLLEIVGLADVRHRYPRELSGGMKQRVAIARALANKPKVLLMDEPFGALDAQTREEMQELMILLNLVEKTTVVFVTHEIEEAIYLSSRILVFSPRPGHVLTEMSVPFPGDRTLDVKMTSQFLELKRELLHHLHAGRSANDREEILRRIRGNPDRHTATHQR